ncbi:hypothetical protein GCM10007275_14730 [Jeotgalicoccus coquinae]|uniref:GNAT superfamily acetyltransferase n=1 Tax=Jeotgalicoccus coquinae TaxID=709509 RepID=A0A6V7R2N0_9STAP|nr:GNAT family N-acetyltransferase [Jeotgalicoccus coquinae]MBB6423550.1 putative GNAT superfamily acetyltransferase [Jeotgalicoccus coquinae]GGE20724.1 hypothetical protein GCM10007275_14730 [Jeotgalicoccus coquinae]CAD2071475.1 hypothetical protein JEOCOQ751_00258 [Jeotgalicoccus coquinae]
MIALRELTTIKDLEQLEKIERNVWDMPPLPIHQTLTAVKNGGVIIGAFDEDTFIGFSYGFTGFKDGQTYLVSHMLGVEKEYRSRKIGEKLKRKQREIAINKGYSLIRWTYDPLETRNAYLNLTKLNGICSVYKENAYGEMKDSINKGLPSDRFEVHWHIASEYVLEKEVSDYSNAAALNKVSIADNLPVSTMFHNEQFNAEVYSLEVPMNFQHVKFKNYALALEWRINTRSVFQKLFAAGYAAVYLIPGKYTAKYIFVRKNTLQLGGHS